MVKMITLAVSIIDRAFDTNRGSTRFLKWLIIGLVIVGVLFGILAYYVSGLLGVVEILIAPALIWVIRSYRSVNKDNVRLLSEANKTLDGARSQAEIEDRIRKEDEHTRKGGE